MADPRVSVITGGAGGIGKASARRLARHEVAKYLAVVGDLDATLDQDETESLREFTRLFRVGDGSASSRISDSLLDKFALAGTPDDALGRLEAMDGLVDVFEFGTPHGLSTRVEAIHYIGREILQERNLS